MVHTMVATRDLKTDMVFSLSNGDITGITDVTEFEVWSDPVPDVDSSEGRWVFMAKDITTGEVRKHSAQPEWEWPVVR